MHGQNHAALLSDRQELVEHSCELVPEFFRSQLSSQRIEFRIRLSIAQSHGVFDFGKIKGRDFGTAAFRCIQSGATPVCARHKVVTQKSNPQIGHLTNQQLQCFDLRSVIATELDVLDRQVSFDNRQSHSERSDAFLRQLQHTGVRARIAMHDIRDSALSCQLQVFVGHRREDSCELHSMWSLRFGNFW